MSGTPPAPSSVPWFRDAGCYAAALCLFLFAAGLHGLNESSESTLTTPLALPLVPAGSSVFQAGAFPADLPGRDELPALGTWNPTDATTTGTWTSAPLTTLIGLTFLDQVQSWS